MGAFRKITISVPAVSCVFPFDVSLNIGWCGEEYPTSCDLNKAMAEAKTYRPLIRKNTFVKRE